jgi:hypothetical protein
MVPRKNDSWVDGVTQYTEDIACMNRSPVSSYMK